jgi:hypothetical protein
MQSTQIRALNKEEKNTVDTPSILSHSTRMSSSSNSNTQANDIVYPSSAYDNNRDLLNYSYGPRNHNQETKHFKRNEDIDVIVHESLHRKSIPHMSSHSLSDNPNRVEMPWMTKNETLLKNWAFSMNELSLHHDKWARIHQGAFYVLSTVMFTIPIVIASLVTTTCIDHPIYIKIPNAMAAICSGFNILFNPARKAQRHRDACNQYERTYRSIMSELHKERPYRAQADVFIAITQLEYLHVKRESP